MYQIVEFSHKVAKDYINELNNNLNICDATCGEGNDTFFLASLLNNQGHIDAYDIQDIAINHTKEKCKDFNNITYHLESHINLNPLDYDLIIFNLGYLPNGDKNITTTANTTIDIINRITSCMKEKDLLLIISVYIGHEEGMKESIELEKLLANLDRKFYQVMKFSSLNQLNAPYVLTIRRKHHE